MPATCVSITNIICLRVVSDSLRTHKGERLKLLQILLNMKVHLLSLLPSSRPPQSRISPSPSPTSPSILSLILLRWMETGPRSWNGSSFTLVFLS